MLGGQGVALVYDCLLSINIICAVTLSFGNGTYQPKTFRKGSEASSRAERRHGYVILVSNEPSCYHAATSERRRIRLKADYYYIALRGASIKRSQRGNSEAVFFR